MKKALFGLVIGVAVMVPVSVGAWTRAQMARPLVGIDCSGPYKEKANGYAMQDKNGDYIIDPSPTNNNGRCSTTVYVFDDSGNKCYVVKGSNASGISCLKQ